VSSPEISTSWFTGGEALERSEKVHSVKGGSGRARAPRACFKSAVADFTEEQMNSALRRASEELSFPSYYEACVRPLLRNPEGHWPRCCAGGCEPCAQTLIKVAQRTLELLGTPRVTPIPEW